MGALSHPVEGEWNNFYFKMIQQEDIEEVLENFREVFCKGEPMAQNFRLTENPAALQTVVNYTESVLRKNEGLSFVARDKVTRKIAGLRVTYMARLGDHDEDNITGDTRIINIFQTLGEMTEKANIFEKYGISEYAELLQTSVNPEYRGQGLVTEIYRRSFALLRSRGIPLCKCIFSNPATHKAGIRHGMEELGRRKFLDFNDDKGNQIFPTALPEQVAVLMVLKL